MDTRLLKLTLDSPLAVSTGRGGASNRNATAVVVPPQTLRGALAAAADRAGVGEETLSRLFGRNGCRTSSLFPAPPGNGPLPQVAPLTLRTCKRRGGFLSDTGTYSDGEPHGAEDLLFGSLQLALREDPSGLHEHSTCRAEGCGNVMKRKSGLIRPTSQGASEENPDTASREQAPYRTQPLPGRRTQTHVGLDRRRDGAASGILYAQEVINEKLVGEEAGEHASEGSPHNGFRPTTMRAAVTGREKDLKALQEALAQEEEVRVGTSLSRGLGRCKVQGEPLRERPAPTPLRERIEQFNDAWDEYLGPADASSGVLIAITLRSPALFVDSFLRPETSPSGADLLQAAQPAEEAHAEALSGLDWVHEVARPYSLEAWNGLAGFPHATDQGLRAGSVLVYRADELTDELTDALAHAERAGIGLRRELGLGRMRVCDPVHVRVHEHAGR